LLHLSQFHITSLTNDAGLDRVEDLSASFTTAADFTDITAPTTPSVSSAEFESVSDADDDMDKTVKPSEEPAAVADAEAPHAKPTASVEDSVRLELPIAESGPSRSVEVEITSGTLDSALTVCIEAKRTCR